MPILLASMAGHVVLEPPGPIVADPIISSKDTWVQSHTPTTSTGSSTGMAATGLTDIAGRTRAMIVNFDLTAIPAGNACVSATLTLWTNAAEATSHEFSVFARTADIDTWVEAQATYNEQATGVPWTNADGGVGPSSRTAAIGVATFPGSASADYALVFTLDAATVAQYFGSVLSLTLRKSGASTNSDTAVPAFRSRNSSSSNKPRLQITHEATDESTVYQTYTLTEIPESAAEVVNPGRGYMQWGGENYVTPNPPAPYPLDAFLRTDAYSWKILEPTRGSYNFTPIINAIKSFTTNGTNGKRYSFRIRIMNSGGGVSDFMPTWHHTWGWCWVNSFGSTVPDWNHAEWLADYRLLLLALRVEIVAQGLMHAVGGIDSAMGAYGEWHYGSGSTNWGLQYPATSKPDQRASNATHTCTFMTTASGQHIIDSYMQAFGNYTRVNGLPANTGVIKYCSTLASYTYRPGLRADSAGSASIFEDAINGRHTNSGNIDIAFDPSDATVPGILADWWKTAPVTLESANTSDVTFADFLDHVEYIHASLIGNGNFDPASFSSYSDAERATAVLVGKRAGYRLVIPKVEVLTETVTAGGSIKLRTTIHNRGVAPMYNDTPYVLEFLLYLAGTFVGTLGTSSLSLVGLLPTGNTPLEHEDTFTVLSIASTAYELRIRGRDADNYLQPLAFACGTRLANGTYSLGTLVIP